MIPPSPVPNGGRPCSGSQVLAYHRRCHAALGGRIQLFASPVTACFVYIQHEDPAGEMTVLFPNKFPEFPLGYGAGQRFCLPAGEHAVEITAPGFFSRVFTIEHR